MVKFDFEGKYNENFELIAKNEKSKGWMLKSRLIYLHRRLFNVKKMMKTQLLLTTLLFFLFQVSAAFGQTLVQKETSLCLIAKDSKVAHCLDLKKSPVAIEYIHGDFRIFQVPGKPVGSPPKDIFQSKQNTLLPYKATIGLEGNVIRIWNAERQRIFELPFLPGTRGVFQLERGGSIALYTEDCLELEPIEVSGGEILYDGSEGASSIYITLVDRDDIRTRLICQEGVGISCIEDNIIDPRYFTVDFDLGDAFAESFPVGYPAGGLDLPEGDGRLAAATNDEPICKECEELTETTWETVCDINLDEKGLYKDCDGHLLVVDLKSGAVCMDVDLSTTAVRVESVEGAMVRLSLPASEATGEGCCPEK